MMRHAHATSRCRMPRDRSPEDRIALRPIVEDAKAPLKGPSRVTTPQSAVGDVHRDFEAETHFGVLRLAPHDNLRMLELK